MVQCTTHSNTDNKFHTAHAVMAKHTHASSLPQAAMSIPTCGLALLELGSNKGAAGWADVDSILAQSAAKIRCSQRLEPTWVRKCRCWCGCVWWVGEGGRRERREGRERSVCEEGMVVVQTLESTPCLSRVAPHARCCRCQFMVPVTSGVSLPGDCASQVGTQWQIPQTMGK